MRNIREILPSVRPNSVSANQAGYCYCVAGDSKERKGKSTQTTPGSENRSLPPVRPKKGGNLALGPLGPCIRYVCRAKPVVVGVSARSETVMRAGGLR